MLMLIATVPYVSAQTENGDCIGQSVEDPRTGNDTCVGRAHYERLNDPDTVWLDSSTMREHLDASLERRSKGATARSKSSSPTKP